MIALIIVFLLMFFLKSSLLTAFANTAQSTSLALGFVLIFAFLFGEKIAKLRFPQITGFILAGVLCGPYILKFISRSDVENLQLLDGLALSLIALTAGGEMKMDRIKKKLKAISSIAGFQTLAVLAGFILLGLIGRFFFPFFFDKTLAQSFVISVLLGTLAAATSPSSTIAVLTESRAKGPYSDLLLHTAIFKDVLVIFVFAFFLSFGQSLSTPGRSFDFGFLFRILKEVGGSLVIGGLVGLGIIFYLRFIHRDLTVFILGIAFFTYQVSYSYGYHPLLICLVAGFLIENFSAQGTQLIQAIERVSTPVFVIFFAISGASLDLGALKETWPLALSIVVWRGVLKFLGTYGGARLAGEEKGIQKRSWAGFVSQAGVALGMAIIVEKTFPGWGKEFKTIVLAVIAINQIIGPVLLQRLLVKVDEVGKKDV